MCISTVKHTVFYDEKDGRWSQYIANIIITILIKSTSHFKSICHFEPHLVDRPVDGPITLYTTENLNYKL